MQSRSLLTAFSILSLAALASIPAGAAAPFTTSRFSITFPDGWQMLPATGGDSLMAVLNPTLLSYCYMTETTTDHPLTAEELEAYRAAYAGSDSVTKVTDGTKSLGGKTFTFVEYQAADTTSGPSRVRIYYANSGGTSLFTSVLIYDPASGAGAVTDMESALATLSLSATPLRAWMARPRPAGRAGIHDLLGRSRPMGARTALYRLPLP